MDASVPVDSRVFMQKCALRTYLADSVLTEVVRPDGRQYTLKHGKMLVEAIAAGIEPLEFRRKVENKMRFDLVTHDPDAVFSIIAKQQRDRALIETNDAVRQQTAKRRDTRSMAVAGTTPQGSTADGHDSRENANTASVKAEQNRRYENKKRFVCGGQGHKQRDCPQSQQGKTGKGVHGQTHGQIPIEQQQSMIGPLSIPGARQPGWPLRLPPLELGCTRPPQRWWLRRPNLLCLNHLRRMTTTTCTFAGRGKGWRQWIMGSPRRCGTRLSQSAGPQNAAPVLHSVPLQLPAPASQQSCGDSSTISYTRVSV